MKRSQGLSALSVFFLVLNLMTPASYADSMLRKLTRGFVNITTAPLEIFVQPCRVGLIDQAGPAGSLAGIFQGFGFMLGRTVAGVYDVATFPVPIPFRYEPVFQPETVFDGISWIKEREWPFPKYGFGRWQERSPVGYRARRNISKKSNVID